jgi:hemin uptake protein HemP
MTPDDPPASAPRNESPADKSSPNLPPVPGLLLQADELMRGHREIYIAHGEALYRLRVTRSGKLLLTK